MTKEINYSIEEIDKTAKIVLSLNPSTKIFIFNGEMGSGKTTIIKAIIKELGYEGIVSSPTFSLINEYFNGDKIYHFDFYRIKSREELLDIGIDEYISSNDWCFIEWPNLIVDMLPDKHIELNIDVISSDNRKIRINY
ncbi:MAG: tRNA (adenosine(37)-N6)-threonylcarbamoyltransferase complex ATPase subunit type 1 TsaE [Flavobacteriaceae bacterium]|nr:tRNA (adenosine(37)-N6)-threonylcarbamoyltransferase complex ATPase subunit type 1 TsaE [Flavobacteriaceae bacterium]